MTNLGNVSHYLGIEVDVKVKKTIKVTQIIYIKPASVSMDPKVTFLFLLYYQKTDHDAVF